MPRPKKRARLWLRPSRRQGGRIVANAVWLIIDGNRHIATGCFEEQVKEAEERLAEYISEKYKPARTRKDVSDIHVADVLSVYLDDCGARNANPKRLARDIERLNEFWGAKRLSDVCTAECNEYVRIRKKKGGARADLEILRAAINHHSKENLHQGSVRVTLPFKGPPRTRWLTRAEVARLIWACWRYRETQTWHRGRRQGKTVTTEKRPLRHLARFILIGIYTGSRAGAISKASPYQTPGHSYVDLDRGIFYRLPTGGRVTNKRQTPAPLPPRLLAHMRRWVSRGVITSHFVEWNGVPVQSVKTAFRHAVTLAGLAGHIVPHTLRHTAATWLMQRNVPVWQAAGYLGMSIQTLERTYGHHDPAYMQTAAKAITSKQGKNVPLVVSLVSTEESVGRRKKT